MIPLLVSEVDVGAFRALSATFALAVTLAVALGARREAAGALNGTDIPFQPSRRPQASTSGVSIQARRS